LLIDAFHHSDPPPPTPLLFLFKEPLGRPRFEAGNEAITAGRILLIISFAIAEAFNFDYKTFWSSFALFILVNTLSALSIILAVFSSGVSALRPLFKALLEMKVDFYGGGLVF
jgi:hypothetical protein